jgi:hypothetical protein
VKIALSTRERAGIAAVMHRSPWLGGAALLHQAALYEALKLGEFVGKDPSAIGRTPTIDRTTFEIPIECGPVLLAALQVNGQSFELALINAGTLRRLDPVLAASSLALAAAAAPVLEEVERTKQKPPEKVSGVEALSRLVGRNHHRRSKGAQP